MINYLSKIDNFGAEFKPRIINEEHEHRSILGGIFTLLVYSVCAAYFTFVVYQWQTGQILPKILIESDVAAFSKFEMPDHLIELTYVRYDDKQIDPFRQNGNILMPIAAILENNKPISFQPILSTDETSIYGTNLIEMEKMEIVKNAHNDKSQENSKFYYLVVTTCKQQYLRGNQTCASEEEISNFLNEGLVQVEIEVILNQFNTRTKELYEVEKQIQFFLQENLTLRADILFQNTQTFIDDHLIFSNSKPFTYFSDFTVVTQTISNNLSRSIIQDDVLMQVAFKIDPIETKQQITYVKIGEMLADVGSIGSLLLTVSWFILQFNKEEMENKIIDEIISVYYPQFKQVKKVKNLMGKTIEIKHEKDQLNKEEFNKWYSKVRQCAIDKLSIINQLHEISRLYFIIRSQINFESLIKYQNYGISLPQKLFQKNQDEINNEFPSKEIKMEDYDIESSKMITSRLCDEDLNIISYKTIAIPET